VIEIKKGKNFNENGEEWENERLINFLENYEKVKNTGKDSNGEWEEQWFEKGLEKWAKKEGINYLSKDQWREEWYERRKYGVEN
jgi:hypothetical protein